LGLKIIEFFGYPPDEQSAGAAWSRKRFWCPFLDRRCDKRLKSAPSGACTVRQTKSDRAIICCPTRLYDGGYRVLKEIAREAFGEGVRLVSPQDARRAPQDGRNVVAFGKGWGGELRLPRAAGRGGYFVDWVLALLDEGGALREFVAVEVQSIDTTGNYQQEREGYLRGERDLHSPHAGMNWENVSKRILPQIIYKGHVLRREERCKKGMFFVCPAPVYERVVARLGESMGKIHPQPGSLTFRWYDIGPPVAAGKTRRLILCGQFTTTVDQVALAFTAPRNLPEPNVYQEAINAALRG
jgi:hypothetical protein